MAPGATGALRPDVWMADLRDLANPKTLEDEVSRVLKLPQLNNFLGCWQHGSKRTNRGTEVFLSTIDIKYNCPGIIGENIFMKQ